MSQEEGGQEYSDEDYVPQASDLQAELDEDSGDGLPQYTEDEPPSGDESGYTTGALGVLLCLSVSLAMH